MRLRYTAEAVAHLSSIYNFLIERNPVAARRVVASIRGAASRLCEFPYIGHKGDDPGTREWVVRGLPYLIVYESVCWLRKSWWWACFTALRIVARRQNDEGGCCAFV